MGTELRRFVSPEIVFGDGARHLAGQYAVQLGASRVLVVSDEGVDAVGWTGQVVDALARQGLAIEVFLGLSSNPKSREIAAGAEVYRHHHADFIVAVGGGSPIDCAKGIGVAVAHDRDVLEFEGIDRLEEPIPPLVCVPTTAGSGADVSQFAIVTDERRRVKVGLVSKALVPDVSLIDPETTVTMPPELTAASGMDAMCHGFEAVFSTASWPLTDLQAVAAIRIIHESLIPAQRNPNDTDLRADIMRAATYAGLAFSNAGLGVVHAMAHAAGGYADAPHGDINAMLLASAVEFNASSIDRSTLEVLARSMGGVEPSGAAIAAEIRAMADTLGVPAGLHELGITRADIAALAEMALKDAALATTPRFPTYDDVVELYARTL